MVAAHRRFSHFAAILFTVWSLPLQATTGWFASTDPGTNGLTIYRSPEEACSLGVMTAYIEADRPTEPPTAQYRVLSSAANAHGDGDYTCTGVVYVRNGPGATQWNLVLFQGDALILGAGDSCNIPNYSDPVTGQCGPPKCTDSCCGSCPNGSNPIHSASGNKHQVENDFVGTGSFPLRFVRTYDSNRAYENSAAPMGAGWTHSYRAFVVGIGSSPFTKAVVYRPDGRVLAFQKTGATWQSDPDVSERLALAADSTGMPIWTLTTNDDSVETYDGIGLLQSIVTRDGFMQSLSYIDSTGHNTGRVQKVVDPEGRSLTLSYNASNQLTGVTNTNANVITYAYTSSNLTSATYPEDGGTTKTRVYSYNESGQTSGANLPHALTGITDELNLRFASWGYTSAGRANLSVHGPFVGGTIDRTSLLFNANGTTTITDALSQPRVFGFAVQYLVARTNAIDQPCDYCAGAAKSNGYDTNGYPQSARDFRDTDTLYTYNTRGLEMQRIDANTIVDPNNPPNRITPPEKRTINTAWNPSLRVPDQRTAVNSAGATESRTNWVYNIRGQAIARCAYDLTVAGAGGYVCATTGTPPAGIRRWVTTYCDAVDGANCPLIGLVRAIDGPRTDLADVTTYAYRMIDDTATPKKYRKGDLWKVTNALNHVIEYQERDGNGRPTKVADANGIITQMTYHPRGWLETRNVKGIGGVPDAITTIAYDDSGNVARVTQPDGAYLAYGYDIAHRLTSITDNTGNNIQYTLNALGNRTSEQTYASGNSTPTRLVTRAFDSLNRLAHQYDAQSRDTQLGYDGNGNRVDQTDPNLVKTHSVYDPLNRLKNLVQDYQGTVPATANATTGFAYDTRDNLLQVTDPTSLTTTYTYDDLDNLDLLASPDTGNTGYSQDSAGNRTVQTDARGVIDYYGYDALNRMTGVKYGSTLSVARYYDQPNITTGCAISYPVGRLTRMVDPSGSTTYCYDHRGNVIGKTQVTAGSTYIVGYEYNVADRLAAINYPDGARAEYTRDSLGRITQVKVRPTSGGALTNVVSTVTYQPFGPALTTTFATGSQSLAMTYDQNYWLTDVAGSVLNLHFCRDSVANITRLKTATPACSGTPTEQYTYDALYRLLQVQNGSGGLVEGYTYNLTGDRLSKTQGTTTAYGYGSPQTQHRLLTVGFDSRNYDNAGNEVHSSAPSQTFTFDDRGRMTNFMRSGLGFGSSGVYDYNDRGERVVKDGVGPLLQHNPAHFVYDESGPLLTDNGNGNPNPTDYVYADGRPIALIRSSTIYYVHTDQLGTPRAVTTAGSATPVWNWAWQGNPFGEQGPTSASFVMSLRFPGQYYDAESGLIYNRWRDYEPGIGRYAESDPIGLSGGYNTYAYVFSNPLGWYDPFGLSAQDKGAVIGCVVGGGVGSYFGAAAGGAVGGGAGLMCGPGAPVCSTAGVTAGGAIGYAGGGAVGCGFGGAIGSGVGKIIDMCTDSSEPDCKKARKECLDQCYPILEGPAAGRSDRYNKCMADCMYGKGCSGANPKWKT